MCPVPSHRRVRATGPKPARRCRGSFSHLVKKGSPSPAGIQISFPPGISSPPGRLSVATVCPVPIPVAEPCPPGRAYRVDPLRAVWSTRGGAPSSSLPRPVKLAEPEFLRPCKQLGKYFGSEFGLSIRVGGELVSPRTRVGRGSTRPVGAFPTLRHPRLVIRERAG
jgi:hypothetical protein